MSRSRCRQVLECGDGVCEVTALAFAELRTPKLAAAAVIPVKAATPKTPSPQSKTLTRRQTFMVKADDLREFTQFANGQ
ncbi:MAG: hypothetical protein HYY24_06580 [Verrucomicrobia bacterium]|nr:hypothetical protein [Verrucomicrobiota bacterium]